MDIALFSEMWGTDQRVVVLVRRHPLPEIEIAFDTIAAARAYIRDHWLPTTGGNMREHINHDAQKVFDRYVLSALGGGCDQKQAEAIARERFLQDTARIAEAARTARKQITATVTR